MTSIDNQASQVIPAQTGIQGFGLLVSNVDRRNALDSGLRRNDEVWPQSGTPQRQTGYNISKASK
jgi:hypothetical protein